VNGVGKRGAGSGRLLAVLAVAALVGVPTVSAQAQDGAGDFFEQLFGGGRQQASVQPLPQPDYGQPSRAEPSGMSSAPPLTVRAKKHRRPTGAQYGRVRRYSPEELKTVTIYTDRTLVRGDAVMTAQGIRIFNGSASLPHAESDFVAISSVDKLPKPVRKELTAIDVAARTDFRSE
jgi:hypothetical protein